MPFGIDLVALVLEVVLGRPERVVAQPLGLDRRADVVGRRLPHLLVRAPAVHRGRRPGSGVVQLDAAEEERAEVERRIGMRGPGYQWVFSADGRRRATVLRSVTLADGSVTDVRLDGRDDRLDRHRFVRPGDDVVDLAGHLLLTAAVEPHAHLDKAFLAERLDNATGDLLGAIEAMVAARPDLDVADTVERAERAARLHGPPGVHRRAHPRRHDARPRAAQHRGARRGAPPGRRRHRRRDRGAVRLAGRRTRRATRSGGCCATRSALGADVVGGCPHLDTDDACGDGDLPRPSPPSTGCGVDLHTDETLDADVAGLAELAELVVGERRSRTR